MLQPCGTIHAVCASSHLRATSVDYVDEATGNWLVTKVPGRSKLQEAAIVSIDSEIDINCKGMTGHQLAEHSQLPPGTQPEYPFRSITSTIAVNCFTPEYLNSLPVPLHVKIFDQGYLPVAFPPTVEEFFDEPVSEEEKFLEAHSMETLLQYKILGFDKERIWSWQKNYAEYIANVDDTAILADND